MLPGICFLYRTPSQAIRQFFLYRYSVTVASAFLELIIQERSSIMERSRKIVKKDLSAAITALKQIPSKVSYHMMCILSRFQFSFRL